MKHSITKIIAAIILGGGIAAAGLFVGNSIKYFKNFDRYVEVKGLSERIVRSNQAVWQISFGSSSNELKQIYTNINNSQKIVVAFLINHGFKANEIQQQPTTIVDNQANSYSSNAKAAQYSANSGITITTNNVDQVIKNLQLTNQLVESGVVISNNNVNYSYTELNNIKMSMLNEALANARKAAQEFAKNSDSSIGNIRTASQGLITISAPEGNSMGDNGSLNKKVRVVTTVQFFLQ